MSNALLLSGGMDSCAIAYWRRPDHAITIDYGQKPAEAEIRAATAIAAELGITHHVLRADLCVLGSGDLAGSSALSIAPVPEWWPFRNQMLITLAAMKCVALGVESLLVGCLRTDGMHTDGQPKFIAAMNEVLSLQEGALRLDAPAIQLDAVELVRESGVPMEVLGWSHSCHTSDYACGLCRGCRKHYETMGALGVSPY